MKVLEAAALFQQLWNTLYIYFDETQAFETYAWMTSSCLL